MKKILTLAIVAITLIPLVGYTSSLPPLIAFQSVLLDEGGNLLPPGPATIQFQILDENHAPIYSETQSVDVVKGSVSALIGNGIDAKGATTGGVPEDIFASGAPRYLQVQVGSQAPEDPMTIVPVPYAQWSQTCAGVADGGVKGAAIAKAAVGFDALAPDVVGKLAAEMSKSQGVVTAQSLGGTGGASQVGVTAKFINSGSSSVQGVLQDIDLSVKKGQETGTFLTGKLNEEITNRTNTVKGVQDQLDMTASSIMKTAINNLQSAASDINNIPGKLKLDHLEPNSASAGDLNMGGHKITNIADPTDPSDAATKKTVTEPPSNVNMGGHKITNMATPSADTDAATKLYVDNKISTDITQIPPMPGGVVAGTYVGDGKSTQVITLSAQITPRVIFLREPSETHLANDFALFFSPGVTSYSSWNGSMSEGGVVRWDQSYTNPGIGITSVNVGKLTVEDNANVSGVTYSYIILGS